MWGTLSAAGSLKRTTRPGKIPSPLTSPCLLYTSEQITMLVEDVIDAIEARFENEIPSQAIGEAVMQRLRSVDQVAYVRYASVYKEFRDVSEFMSEISALGKPKK